MAPFSISISLTILYCERLSKFTVLKSFVQARAATGLADF